MYLTPLLIKFIPQKSFGILFITLVFSLNLNSQILKRGGKSAARPNFPISMGLGIGSNYGMLGVKTIVGKNNSGLLLGLGSSTQGDLSGQVGFQFSRKDGLFINAGIGTYGIVVENEKSSSINGGIVMVGAMIDLTPSRRLFLDLGGGYAFGGSYENLFGQEIKVTALIFHAGLAYRIGNLRN